MRDNLNRCRCLSKTELWQSLSNVLPPDLTPALKEWSMTIRRHMEHERVHYYDWMYHVLIRCPRCGAQAVSRCRSRTQASKNTLICSHRHPGHRSRQLSCAACGYSQSRIGNDFMPGPKPIDPTSGHDLWLQARTAHSVVYAYNLDHLAALKSFIAADQRERRRFEYVERNDPNKTVTMWRNSTYFSRLPRWMKLAKNRVAIVRAIEMLERSC